MSKPSIEENTSTKALEIQKTIEENPGVLERLSELPSFKAVVASHYSGPVPSPKMLAEYERILPGLANRLITLTETEQSNRHTNVNKAMDLESKQNKRSQWMAYSLVIFVLGIAVYFEVRGETAFALATLGFDIGGVLFIFGYSRKYRASKQQN